MILFWISNVVIMLWESSLVIFLLRNTIVVFLSMSSVCFKNVMDKQDCNTLKRYSPCFFTPNYVY